MWRRHRYRSAQRDDLDTLQQDSDPLARLLAGERLVESVTADRNRALVAACTEHGRATVAEALGITRQAVYKRLQGAAVGQLVRTPRDGDRRSRIRALMPTGVFVETGGASDERQPLPTSDVSEQLVAEGAASGD